MTRKAKIKIIKKSEVKITKTPAPVRKYPKQNASNEMASTVSNWVNEFRLRRTEETKQAFERFLAQEPQTT
jgi:hypothetical protein